MAERKKQVKATALLKMETFLNEVYLKIGKGDVFSLDALARTHNMSGSVATVIKRMNVVSKISSNTWTWIYPKAPERSLALTLLDEVNRKNGNWNNGDMLTKALSQEQAQPKTLFDPVASVSERVYIAGCIASGMYYPDLLHDMDNEQIDQLNENITFATNNLINKIYKPKSQSNE